MFAAGTEWPSRVTSVPGGSLLVRDTGGPGPVIVFLHGLGGHAMEWWPVVSHLPARYRAVGLDQRGHGASTTRPDDLGRAAYVNDAVDVIEGLGVGPVVLVGQSFGAHTALLVAADRPELVSLLVLVEGGVGGGSEEGSQDAIDWFGSWPTPFPNASAAVEYFGGGTAGEAWAAGLEQTATGLVPRFDLGVLHDAIRAVHTQPRWAEWAAIGCPALLVKGDRGFLSQDEADEMLTRNGNARIAVIQDAGHDVHLDAADQLAIAISKFVEHYQGSGS